MSGGNPRRDRARSFAERWRARASSHQIHPNPSFFSVQVSNALSSFFSPRPQPYPSSVGLICTDAGGVLLQVLQQTGGFPVGSIARDLCRAGGAPPRGHPAAISVRRTWPRVTLARGNGRLPSTIPAPRTRLKITPAQGNGRLPSAISAPTGSRRRTLRRGRGRGLRPLAGERPAPVGDLGAEDPVEDRARAGERPAPVGDIGAEDAAENLTSAGNVWLPSAIPVPRTRPRIAPAWGNGRLPSAISAPRTQPMTERARGTAGSCRRSRRRGRDRGSRPRG